MANLNFEQVSWILFLRRCLLHCFHKSFYAICWRKKINSSAETQIPKELREWKYLQKYPRFSGIFTLLEAFKHQEKTKMKKLTYNRNKKTFHYNLR